MLLLSAVLNLYQIQWGLPIAPGSPLGWAADGVAPLGPLVYAKRTFVDGSWSHKYPAFHFIVLGVAYAPYVAYLKLTGQFGRPTDSWPYGLANPVQALSMMILLARLVSAAMGTAMVCLIYLITRRLGGPTAGLFAGLAVACSFPLIYYAHTSNVDVPYLFWFTLALFFYVRLLQQDRVRDAAYVGACLALAIATKDQAYGLLPGLPLGLVWYRLRSGRPFPWRHLGLALGVFVGVYALAANLVNNWSGFLRHIEYITGAGSAPYQQFPRTVAGQLGLLGRTIWQSAWSLNIPLFLAGLGGIGWGLWRWRPITVAVLLPVVSYYVTFIGVVSFIYPRYALPFVLVGAIFAGLTLQRLWSAPRPLALVSRPAIAVLLVYSALYGASVHWLMYHDPRYRAEDWLRRNIRAGADVEAFGPAQYLPRFPKTLQVRRVMLDGYVQDAFRQRMPEYVLLTWAYYRRITEDDRKDFDQEELLEQLWNGRLGYRVAADFRAPDFVAPNLIPGLNSRITILERTQQAQQPVRSGLDAITRPTPGTGGG